MSDRWRTTATELPADGTLCEVPNNGGMRLVFDRRLWWLPDRSMYVYFTPTYWKEAADG